MKRFLHITFHSNLLRKLVIILLFSAFFNLGCEKKQVQKEDAMPVIWKFQLPGECYYCSPALSIDEKTVYAGTSTLPDIHRKSQFFLALDAKTGKEKWRLNLGVSEVRSAPAVSSDNSIFFTIETRDQLTGAVKGDELLHVSESGELLWQFNINPENLIIGVGLSAPAIGLDGTIYAGGDKLYAISQDGTLLWTFSGLWPEAVRNSPSIGKDGTIYFVYHNVPLTALNPTDGSVKWSLPLGVDDHCFSSPAIGADGTIYVATQPGLLYAVSSSGQLLWIFDLATVGFNGTFRSSPSIDADGSIYIGLNAGSPSSAFFSLHPDGTLKWLFEPGNLPPDVPGDHFDIYSSPAIGSGGVIYFGQEFGRIYALKTADGSVIAMATTNSGITWSSPAINKEGVLFINDISGMVYALQTCSNGLDPFAQWPKFRFDNQNRGRTSH